MSYLKHVVCWVLDHEWSVATIESHDSDEHAPVKVTEVCQRCKKEQIVWMRPR